MFCGFLEEHRWEERYQIIDIFRVKYEYAYLVGRWRLILFTRGCHTCGKGTGAKQLGDRAGKQAGTGKGSPVDATGKTYWPEGRSGIQWWLGKSKRLEKELSERLAGAIKN
ncbi:hypothetical protein NPIL_691681 [Nephila pilipes]|uniref:Uncharacterized protein n=1 Tax=Nephila pilipes TaxID=299642 RepID=A0A8X6I671_NEPPI|nr:hypothetical protein NPIL_691681 [Nephila pilipes]